MNIRALLLIAGLFLAPSAAFCQSQWGQAPSQQQSAAARQRAACRHGTSSECGWWWKLDQQKAEPKQRPKPQASEQASSGKTSKPKKIDCHDPSQWKAPCGFIDPGHSYAFQAKQRDALRKRMVMNPNDPKAVRGFQEYNNWILTQAIAVADMWKFNSTQDPSLNPALDHPVSRFGLKLLSKEQNKTKKTIYKMIRDEGGFFVWFTRSDCSYCHGMLDTIVRLQKETRIPVHNASLDGTCMTGFTHANCVTGSESRAPAAKLKVRVVPDLLLYMPQDNTWIRIATGVVSLQNIEARIKLFVGAMQAAYENAVKNSETKYGPNVDFIDKAKVEQDLGMGKGIDPSQGDSSK